ncbi:hypothetical protein SAMN02745132_00722 [Enterovibrio nigricans DSM 22720]|uniref:Uncharacterized protein n=1 Tax=Enterovibrio nigricans DSM 22720 TaxID=1121868 RepID=A0A1T4U458_9GAMM|nr:hypothetical protein SAMN02745132_00722 [Enterovibrio nigricans DSM 22720]
MPIVCAGLTQVRGNDHDRESSRAWIDRTYHLVVLVCRKDKHQMNNDKSNAYSVERKLRLNDVLSQEVQEQIASIAGIQSVTARKHCMVVTYDVRDITLERIESRVNIPYSQSLWQRLRRSLYHYGDRNLADGAQHVPHCCNKISKR